jgi:hypothetical protein
MERKKLLSLAALRGGIEPPHVIIAKMPGGIEPRNVRP